MPEYEFVKEPSDEFETTHIPIYTPPIYNKNIVKYGNIYVSEYSLGNIIFRINLVLTRSKVSYSYDALEFKWNCYFFVQGRYCKFSIRIFLIEDSSSYTQTFLIDIEKTVDSGFIYRKFLNRFRAFFVNIASISNDTKNKIFDHDFVFTADRLNMSMFPIYTMGLDEMSNVRSKEESLSCIDFLLEILEYKSLHAYGINVGIHFKLCYLLLELEFEKDDKYEMIDTVMYIIYLLTMSPEGKVGISKCQSFVDFLHKKIHQDLEPYEMYTLELAHLIIQNLA